MNKMIIEELKGEKLGRYKPVYINRKTGEQSEAEFTISLFPSEVIDRQIAQSTDKTIVMFKAVKL